jgi:hypothetical protein
LKKAAENSRMFNRLQKIAKIAEGCLNLLGMQKVATFGTPVGKIIYKKGLFCSLFISRFFMNMHQIVMCEIILPRFFFT